MLTHKHKTGQLIKVNKIPSQAKEPIMKVFKEKLMFKACSSVQLCIAALKNCMRTGYLPLKYGGYQRAWTLQNPYLPLVPKSGIEVRVRIYL